MEPPPLPLESEPPVFCVLMLSWAGGGVEQPAEIARARAVAVQSFQFMIGEQDSNGQAKRWRPVPGAFPKLRDRGWG